jgi:hypothetical protein
LQSWSTLCCHFISKALESALRFSVGDIAITSPLVNNIFYKTDKRYQLVEIQVSDLKVQVYGLTMSDFLSPSSGADSKAIFLSKMLVLTSRDMNICTRFSSFSNLSYQYCSHCKVCL